MIEKSDKGAAKPELGTRSSRADSGSRARNSAPAPKKSQGAPARTEALAPRVNSKVKADPLQAPKETKREGARNTARVKTEAARVPARPKADSRRKNETRRKSSPTRPRKVTPSTPAGETVRIIPLGGLQEIGKNMTAIEYGNEIIVVDCGIAFPDDNMPGIDMIIPDFSFLKDHFEKVKALVLTHGHEDHIGAVAWFMQNFDCPVYATPLTLKLIERKLTDAQRGGNRKFRNDPRLQLVHAGDTVGIGRFKVEFIHVNHSIADAVALCIETPIGRIIHSGDFKIDFTPVHGQPINLGRFAELGNQGVLALLMESTNVEVSGMTPSERMVGESLKEIIERIKGRVFVATFSSNVFRLQQIISAAEAYNRKVVLLGRSMLQVFEAADSLSYIHYRKDTLIDISEVGHYPDNRLLFITTGTQGEPMSALSRMAFSEHQQVQIRKGDSVLLSSSVIPGNEKSIYRVINELFKSGAEVIYEKLADIHVSGHAYRGELELLLNLCKPKYFIPVHGEYRHLRKHANISLAHGMSEERVFVLSNGDVLALGRDEAKVVAVGVCEAGGVLIDGSGVGDIDQLVLKDRIQLADEGIVSCSLVFNTTENRIVAGPVIKTAGFIDEKVIDRLSKLCSERVFVFEEKLRAQNKPILEMMKAKPLRDQLRNVLYEETQRRPLVLVTVIEV